MKEAFCCLNTIAGKVGPSYRPHYLLHSILWAVSSLEHSRTLFPRIQNPTKAHLYTLHQLQTSQRPETLQRSNDSLLWAQIMNLFNGFHFIFTKYSPWLWRISQVVFSPPRKLWFDFWIYRGSYWIYYNLTTGILMCLNFYMVTVRGHCRQCRTLFSPIDIFSIVLRTIGPSLTSDPRLTSAGTSPVWAHTTYSKRGHFGHQDVKLERLRPILRECNNRDI